MYYAKPYSLHLAWIEVAQLCSSIPRHISITSKFRTLHLVGIERISDLLEDIAYRNEA